MSILYLELKYRSKLKSEKGESKSFAINTASHKKGTTLKVANSEFQFFCYYVMGPYE